MLIAYAGSHTESEVDGRERSSITLKGADVWVQNFQFYLGSAKLTLRGIERVTLDTLPASMASIGCQLIVWQAAALRDCAR